MAELLNSGSTVLALSSALLLITDYMYNFTEPSCPPRNRTVFILDFYITSLATLDLTV